MTVTTLASDKYAFLFTGPTSIPQHLRDIEHVYETLTEYYNYLPGNIKVVCGSVDATPSVGVTVTTISTIAQLQSEIDSFISGIVGMNKTAVLYFTGNGCTDGGVSKLVIDGSNDCTSALTVDPTWLANRLSGVTDPANQHIHVVMQQSYSGGFNAALTSAGLSQYSFTYSCTASQSCHGDSDGSFFTQGWVGGLQLETLPGDIYADQLGSGSEGSNRVIALQEAMNFGKQVHDAGGWGFWSTPGYLSGGGPQYLGWPELHIRDGSPSWWESPDIFLTHPNDPVPPGDLYIPDDDEVLLPGEEFNNTVNVQTRNIGTHPIRAYSLRIARFGSGLGPTGLEESVTDIPPAAGLLLPIEESDIGGPDDKYDTYLWNTPFVATATHTCVKAEAKLLGGDLDSLWNVPANDFEGQRNIDEIPMLPAPTPLVYPQLQGFKEHVYGINNPFNDQRRIFVMFPEDFDQYSDKVALRWFEAPQGPKSEKVPIPVDPEPVAHLTFELKAKEARNILVRTEMKEGFGQGEEVNLAFGIFAEGQLAVGRETRVTAAPIRNLIPLAGITLKLRRGGATLAGAILDKGNKPVENANVILRAANGLQSGVAVTAKGGSYHFDGINPDIYYVRAKGSDWQSEQQKVVLTAGMTKEISMQLTEKIPTVGTHVKVILDRIRILNDHEPFFKGKGELTFSAEITPDHDPSAKQVTRLPAKGVYKVSDKAGRNDIELAVTLFDGIVQHNALSITISGVEKDFLDPDDKLKRYNRTFVGNPENWYGQYYPSNEYLDKEDVGDWALWYRIEKD